MKRAVLAIIAAPLMAQAEAEALPPRLSLRDTVWPTAVRDLADGGRVVVRGTVEEPSAREVWVRVTDAFGRTSQARADVREGAFRLVYPDAFADAPAARPAVLFVDASLTADFAPFGEAARTQAEATLILVDSGSGATPDLPSAFTNDLLDASDRTDAASREWPTVRALVNLYMHSRGAVLAHCARPGFDLSRPEALAFFRESLALYDFDHRDRRWDAPLNHRPRRHFWQAVWDTWFNSSNNHPLDGNPANRSHDNYLPYTFTNDYADILLCYLERTRLARPLDDNLETICSEGLATLRALQIADGHPCEPDEGPGTFHYGMFEDGTYLVRGKGWFHNPAHRDFARGGVFLGRAVWALGVGLQLLPDDPQADDTARTIARALRWAFGASREHGYCRLPREVTPVSHRLVPGAPERGRIWRDPGEHGYLLLGMLAARQARPDLPVFGAGEYGYAEERDLDRLCGEALEALAATARVERLWMRYSDKDAVTIAALARGARELADHPRARLWRRTVLEVADAWLAARPDPGTYRGDPVHVGFRHAPGRMTYAWPPNGNGTVRITFFKTGLWIIALEQLFELTGDTRYAERLEALVGYLCGANPFHARMLTEIGGIYNWVDDSDGDGIEDRVRFNMYPESTAFCHYGIMRYLQVRARGHER